MKSIYKILILFSIQILCSNWSIAQNQNFGKFENRFFTLDFENKAYNFSEIKKYFFTTFPHDDPTFGDVIYDRKNWINKDVIVLKDYDGLYAYIKSRKDTSYFDSFRLTSKPYFNLNDTVHKILFVFKGKIPSTKGLWPAWWLNGSKQDEWTYKEIIISDEYLDNYSGKGNYYDTPSPVNCTDWPGGGEVDIIETINGNNVIYNTIHTCPNMCDSEWNDDGIIINCANATQSDPNSGCSGKSYKVNSTEGTFACLWENNSFSFYYWPIEVDVREDGGPLSNSPTPNLWNKSYLKNYVNLHNSDSECDRYNHHDWQCENCKNTGECEFKNLKMIFNITLCGKWAGSEFDNTENSLSNCKKYIEEKGREEINNQFIKIEYVSVTKIQ